MDALPEELQLLIVEKLCLMPGFPRALAAFSATARGWSEPGLHERGRD